VNNENERDDQIGEKNNSVCEIIRQKRKRTYLMRTDMRRPSTTVKRRGIIAVTCHNYTFKRSY